MIKIPISSFLTLYRSSIHTTTKLDVGYRLSRSGLAVAYGQQVEFQGPIVQNVVYINGSKAVHLLNNKLLDFVISGEKLHVYLKKQLYIVLQI